jgi:hypothetical protein
VTPQASQRLRTSDGPITVRFSCFLNGSINLFIPCGGYWFVMVAVVPSNFVMLMLKDSLYELARSCKTLSAACSPKRIDQ